MEPVRRLQEETPHDPARPFARRERVAELLLAGALLAAAAALAATAAGPVPLGLAAGLTLAFALSARVGFHVGAGVAVPTQLVLVPMLFLLPPGIVPLLVAAALATTLLPGRPSPERIAAAVTDAWHALAPALLLVLAGGGAVVGLDPWLVLAALAAQVAGDATVTVLREWAGRGIAPAVQLRVAAPIAASDALLTPIGALAVAAGSDRPVAAFAGLALVALLALLAHDRAVGVRRAAQLTRANEAAAAALRERLDELDRERARVRTAIERVARSFSASLDRDSLVDIVLQTAVDAVGADCGRIRLESGATSEHGACAAQAGALAAAERAGGDAPDGRAVARRLGEAGTLAVARRDPPFDPAEHHVLDYLAANAAASFANIALHELAARQAVTDELTGLANHRRFCELLAGQPGATALVMLDLDDFKLVNDRHGHQVGDAVLRAVGEVVRANCRETDEAARYGGEEIVVLMPDMPLQAAHEAAERMRRAIAAAPLPLPGGGTLRVTASVGVAAIPAGGSHSALVAAADAALYEAKRGGKNRTRARLAVAA